MFNNFIKYIRSLFKKRINFNDEIDSYSSKDLFEKINVGDIYYAHMPLPKEELIRIDPAHRIRPYVIISKDNQSIYAYLCSSKLSHKLKNHQFVQLVETRKKGYIYLDKIHELPIENIVSYVTTLNNKTKQNIAKRLTIAANHNQILPNFNIDFNIDVGDIFVIDRQFYYVYQRDNTLLYTHKVYKNQSIQNEKLISVRVNNSDLYISYLKQQQFNAKENYRIMYNLTSDQQEYIKITKFDRKRKKKREQKKPAPTKFNFHYTPGQIIRNIDGEYVYFYSIKNKKYGVLLDELYAEFPRLLRIKNNDFSVNTEIISITDLLDTTQRFITYKINPHNVFIPYYQYISNLYEEKATKK